MTLQLKIIFSINQYSDVFVDDCLVWSTTEVINNCDEVSREAWFRTNQQVLRKRTVTFTYSSQFCSICARVALSELVILCFIKNFKDKTFSLHTFIFRKWPTTRVLEWRAQFSRHHRYQLLSFSTCPRTNCSRAVTFSLERSGFLQLWYYPVSEKSLVS